MPYNHKNVLITYTFVSADMKNMTDEERNITAIRREHMTYSITFFLLVHVLLVTIFLKVKNFTNSNVKEASKKHPLIADGILFLTVKLCCVRV